MVCETIKQDKESAKHQKQKPRIRGVFVFLLMVLFCPKAWMFFNIVQSAKSARQDGITAFP